MLTLDHAPSNVRDHEDHLIADVSPSPYPLMMRVVGLDERVVRCTLEGEVPLVLGSWMQSCRVEILPKKLACVTSTFLQTTLTNSRQSFHLNIDHSFITARITNDDGLLVVHVGGYVGVRRHPFTVSVA